MDISVLTALIALSGVILSVIISFLVNKKTLETEFSKINTSIEQNYAAKILEKRLSCYLEIYQSLSDYAKQLRTGHMGIGREVADLESLTEFRKQIDDLNSKYGVLFSNETMWHFSNLRNFTYNFIKSLNSSDYIELYKLKEASDFLEKIGNLEISLKKDIGIFIVEFQDARRKMKIDNYTDLKELRKS